MNHVYRAINYIAFGFLFCVVNLNVTFTSFTINITPAWLGYILLYFGLSEIKEYKYSWLRYFAIVLAVFDLVLWIVNLFNIANVEYVRVVLAILHAVFAYLLMGVIIEIAKIEGSAYVAKFQLMRLISTIAYILSTALILLAMLNDKLAIAAVIAGIIVLIAYIFTCILLFRFRKELKDREEI